MTPEIETIRKWQKEVHALSKKKGWYACKTCKGHGWTPNQDGPAGCGECAGTGTIPPNDDAKITKQLLNIHAEISEASEFLRKDNEGFPLTEIFNSGYRDKDGNWVEVIDRKAGIPKPDGFAIELADAVIRLLDLAEYLGIDLGAAIVIKHAFNEHRAYRHGGKKY